MENLFLEAMSRAGIPATSGLIFDGKLRRYNVAGDKKGRKNGWYRFVRLRADFAYGSFGCNKRGISEKWSSKERTGYTKYDASLVRKKQAAIEKEVEAAQSKAAILANKLWARAAIIEDESQDHEYLASKGVKSYGLRVLNTMIAIPMYIDNYMVSMQFIARDGYRRFLSDGKAQGAFYWLGAESDTLYLCEGYATAASIHEATGRQVVMTFSAGNLGIVAASIRAKLPDKKIIICADNDQWTKGNPGISYAQEAADKIGATILFPKFSYDDPAQPTDWNDYHVRYGLAALGAELLGLTKPTVPAIRAESDWKLQLLEGKEHRPGFPAFDPKSRKNAFLFMSHHDKFKEIFVHNVFTDTIYVASWPPWENPEKFLPRELRDTDAPMMVCELESLGINISKDTVWDYILKIAHDNPRNPPKEYFESLVWDRVSRLDSWLDVYLGAREQPKEYLALAGSRWMMGAVSRVYQPGCKFDHVLILEGKQDIKKSTAFETLATFNDKVYFLEFSGDVNKTDSLTEMQGNLIVEMTELASLGRVDFNSMKAFLTRKIDKYRPPYGRTHVERPRYFVFGATTNNDNADGYLLDPTGGKRYLPVECSKIDIDALRADREQLWAEAVTRWKSGERTWFEDSEKDSILLEQSNRQYKDSWIQPVESYLIGKNETTVYEVCRTGMNLTSDQINSKNEKRVARCLKDLGWKITKDREYLEIGRRVTLWRKENV